MKEELVEKANTILTMLVNSLEKAGDLAQSEAPLIIKEYITYYIIQEFPITGIVMLLVFSVMAFLGVKHFKNKEYNESESRREVEDYNKCMKGFRYSIITSYIFVASLMSMHILNDLKKVYMIKEAPKAFLIEKFRK